MRQCAKTSHEKAITEEELSSSPIESEKQPNDHTNMKYVLDLINKRLDEALRVDEYGNSAVT